MTQAFGIKGSGVSVSINKTPILNDLSFGVRSGSITGLIGPSGSGKTTLMRSIVGVQKISDGMLTVLDLPAGDKRLSYKIGYVTQNAVVYDDLTVVQNLRYFAVLAQSSREQVDEIITKVQLQKQRDQIVSSLSGGQRARVSLAVALLGYPELLVLDEPTVGLDPVLRQELWQLFSTLASQGKTLLISSHVMDEADRCDELLLLRDGKILWNHSRERLLQTTKTDSVGDAFIRIISMKGKA
ncbi:MAG TPA: ABC transporter ATP-binding protein [Candidatus Saccharibacteria bacterium]|nr:ABC transporter ATP-binding protein [Candidatus Saccharibacteria bacterium]HRQ06578.1 ABC transporter ATP-binding protein [Candidatus Saccharibacteria bacterium]